MFALGRLRVMDLYLYLETSVVSNKTFQVINRAAEISPCNRLAAANKAEAKRGERVVNSLGEFSTKTQGERKAGLAFTATELLPFLRALPHLLSPPQVSLLLLPVGPRHTSPEHSLNRGASVLQVLRRCIYFQSGLTAERWWSHWHGFPTLNTLQPPMWLWLSTSLLHHTAKGVSDCWRAYKTCEWSSRWDLLRVHQWLRASSVDYRCSCMSTETQTHIGLELIAQVQRKCFANWLIQMACFHDVANKEHKRLRNIIQVILKSQHGSTISPTFSGILWDLEPEGLVCVLNPGINQSHAD